MEWKNELKQLPDEDSNLVLYLEHERFKHWNYIAQGSFHYGKFYAKGGIHSDYRVTHWDYLNEPLKAETPQS